MNYVHHHIWRPYKSVLGNSNNERARSYAVSCDAGACALRDAGKCAMVGVMADRCPHGKAQTAQGFTKRARKYQSWIDGRKNAFKGVPKLGAGSTYGLAVCGEHVYLPYAHMHFTDDRSRIADAMLGGRRREFVPVDEFTPDLIAAICRGRPLSVMGGEIRQYQEESVPRFLIHLRERMPELAARVSEQFPELGERIAAATNVGREAVLATLAPNVGAYVFGERSWQWDGEFLTCSGGRWVFIPDRDAREVRIRPSDGFTVTVTDDAQCTPDTKFTT